MIENRHIVRRLTIDLHVPEGSDASGARNDMLNRLHQSTKKRLEDVMSSVCGPEETVRIDRLELDLGDIDIGNFDESFLNAFRVKLSHEVNKLRLSANGIEFDAGSTMESPRPDQPFTKSVAERLLDAWLAYLSTGMMPWWSSERDPVKMSKQIARLVEESGQPHSELFERGLRRRSSTQLDAAIMRWFHLGTPDDAVKWYEIMEKVTRKDHSAARQKQIKQFSLLYAEILNQLFPYLHQEVIRIAHYFGTHALLRTEQLSAQESVHSEFLRLLLARFSNVSARLEDLSESISAWVSPEKEEKPTGRLKIPDSIARALKKLTPTEEKQKEMLVQIQKSLEFVPKPKIEKDELLEQSKEIKRDAEDWIQIVNGGVILVWPMLKTLFESRGLFRDGTFSGEEERFVGLQLLNYLVSGSELAEEEGMIVNKILVGLPIESVPVFLPKLTDADRAEVDALLQHVLSTWVVLKNTSPDALREAFLSRTGNLIEHESHWQLDIDARGIDALLSSFPWGYNTVNCSWMEKIMMVEW